MGWGGVGERGIVMKWLPYYIGHCCSESSSVLGLTFDLSWGSSSASASISNLMSLWWPPKAAQSIGVHRIAFLGGLMQW